MNNVLAIVLCGGKGTRLHSVTKDKIPKCMVEVAGKPFLWHVLNKLEKSGVRRAVLATGHLGELIEQWRPKDVFGSNLTVTTRGDYGCDGTGTAVRSVVDYYSNTILGGDTILVVNGDTYWTGNYGRVVAAQRFSGQFVTVCDRKRVPVGVYASHSDLLRKIPQGAHLHLDRDVVGAIPKKQLLRLPCLQGETFYDIGTPERLAVARKYFETRGN